jgi:catechol 2,3-dioxygenase-like lactoylglutathione lyase family enzyme
MPVQVTAIMLGVADLARSKQFYAEGLGAAVEQDHPNFVSLNLGNGTALALYDREAAAQDAGVPSQGSGFSGVSFHYITATSDEVDATIHAAVAAGGAVVKAPAGSQWGGYSGYFADPDGFLWKVAANA